MAAITTEIHPGSIAALAGILPQDSPVVMLNLVRYNNPATYAVGSTLPPCSGREAYIQRYAPAFNQVAAAEGVTGVHILYVGSAKSLLVGPADELWDDVAVVQYPNFTAFRTIVESPNYQEIAAPHRKAALANWRLLATVPITQG